MKKNFSGLISLCFMILLALNAGAQQVQPLPIDPKVRFGKLDNGLT